MGQRQSQQNKKSEETESLSKLEVKFRVIKEYHCQLPKQVRELIILKEIQTRTGSQYYNDCQEETYNNCRAMSMPLLKHCLEFAYEWETLLKFYADTYEKHEILHGDISVANIKYYEKGKTLVLIDLEACVIPNVWSAPFVKQGGFFRTNMRSKQLDILNLFIAVTFIMLEIFEKEIAYDNAYKAFANYKWTDLLRRGFSQNRNTEKNNSSSIFVKHIEDVETCLVLRFRNTQ